MTNESYRFKLGDFECIAVMDGTRAYPVQAFFANAPKEQLEQALGEHGLRPDGSEEYISPYPGLVVFTGDGVVLIDTGAGGMAPSTGKLMANLEAERISPEDIDTVILTHGHADHIGGNVDSTGKPAFPNARYVMWKDEWDFWTSDPDLTQLKLDESKKQFLITAARDNLLPIEGQLDLIDSEREIVPGIHAVSTPGHTPGHIGVSISSGDENLLCLSDAALHPIHIAQPDWYFVADLNPEEALASRRRLMDKAAADKALVFGFHFPFPGLGHVVKKGEGWQWQPIDTAG